MFNAIVVGTDGSPTASEAVRQAIALAAVSKAQLHLVSAFRVMPATAVAATLEPSALGVLGTDDWVQASRDAAEELLERAAGWARDQDVDTVCHACAGQAAEAILNVAGDTGCDLIVVGDKGMAGVRRFLAGSVPNTVAHHAPCSVMIVNSTSRARATKEASARA